MSTATMALSNTQVQLSPRHTARIYLKEAKYEFLKNLRLRVYTASVLSFPIMFYVLFGLVLNSKQAIGGTTVPTYLIATYGTFGVMGASLFGTAAGLASDRGLGWLAGLDLPPRGGAVPSPSGPWSPVAAGGGGAPDRGRRRADAGDQPG